MNRKEIIENSDFPFQIKPGKIKFVRARNRGKTQGDVEKESAGRKVIHAILVGKLYGLIHLYLDVYQSFIELEDDENGMNVIYVWNREGEWEMAESYDGTLQ